MRKHRLPELIKYIDVRGVNKSMIEFKANLDKLNDFFSIFPKWGISVTIKLLKELRNDSEAMCNKYFSIISERILNELSARPDGLDVESYKKEASQLKMHFNRIKLCMRNTDFRFFIHEGLNEDMFYVSNNKVYGNLNTMYFYVNENSRYAECGDESFILNKLQDICHELNELRQYDILNALPKLIKDSPNEGYVVDSNAFDECMDKVLYKR